MTAPTKVSAEHHAHRADLMEASAEVADQMWSQIDPERIVDSWAELVPELNAVVSGAQLGAARTADSYTAETLAAQGLDDATASPVDPAGFSGVSAEGGPLMSLLTHPAFVTVATIADIHDLGQALSVGRSHLSTIVRTEVADAGRLADQTSLTAHHSADGYIRQTDGNPCKRCLLLAGKFYQFNRGFQRHPRCGCTHIPAARGMKPLDPRAMYDRMTPAQRVRAGFTEAEMLALDEGADIFQVVNLERGAYVSVPGRSRRVRRPDGTTTEGTTRHGFARSRLGRGRPRLTVDQIYADAVSREHAIELLYRNGYLLQRPVGVPRMATAARLQAVPSGATARAAGGEVRAVLASAETAEDVSRVLAAELRQITGRDIRVNLGGSVETAREHAEGVLRALERYPNAEIDEVVTDRLLLAYAEWDNGKLIFSERYSRLDRRQRYLEELAGDASTKWHPYDNPIGMAVHEVGHALDVGALGRVDRVRLQAILDQHGGVSAAGRVSGYAGQNVDEFVAEAFADVVMNGPRASALSRQVVDLIDSEYRRVVGPPGVGRLPSAPDVSRMTVPQLRQVLRDAQVAIPAGARKADLVRMVEELPPTRVVAPAKAAAKKAAAPAKAAKRVPAAQSAEFDAAVEQARKGSPALRSATLEFDGQARGAARAGRGFEDAFPDAAERERIVAAIGRYQFISHKEINELMRTGNHRPFSRLSPDEARAAIADIRAAMQHARLADDVVVWRGADGPSVFGVDRLPADLVGVEFGDAAFVSTSVAERQARKFAASQRDVVMQIVAPRGTPAIQLSKLGGRGGEGELLLGDGLRFRVVRDHGVVDGSRRIDVEVVPSSAPAKKATARKAATPDLTGARGLSDVPAVREVQIENRVRQAYQDAVSAGGRGYLGRPVSQPGAAVRLSEVRRRLVDLPRAEVDDALRRIGRADGTALGIDEAAFSLTPADRAAAIRYGGEQITMFRPRDPSLRPLPAAPAKAAKKAAKAAPAKKATKAAPAKKVAAPPVPQRMTIPALRSELEKAGVTVPPRVSKATLADEVTALRGGTPAREISERLSPPRARVIDRTLSPDDVLRHETAARQAALSAPPVKLQDLRGADAAVLKYYQRHGDEHMLGLMRRGRVGKPAGFRGAPPTVEQVQASIDKIRRLMDQSVIGEPIVVYRGMAGFRRVFRDAGEPGSLVGRTFRDKGFVSTSADRRLAMDFMAGEGFAADGILMEIRVPPGVRGIQISNDDFAGLAPTNAGVSEREILLQDGLRFRIVSDEMVDDIYRWGGGARAGEPYRHVVVEVIP